MSPTGLAIIYIIIWWIVFFAILPIDVERKKSIKIEGEDASTTNKGVASFTSDNFAVTSGEVEIVTVDGGNF